MSRYSSHDPYLDPASGVLKNRFGIADEATLGGDSGGHRNPGGPGQRGGAPAPAWIPRGQSDRFALMCVKSDGAGSSSAAGMASRSLKIPFELPYALPEEVGVDRLVKDVTPWWELGLIAEGRQEQDRHLCQIRFARHGPEHVPAARVRQHEVQEDERRRRGCPTGWPRMPSAPSPSDAVMTSWPSARKIFSTAARIASSSSTTRIRLIWDLRARNLEIARGLIVDLLRELERCLGRLRRGLVALHEPADSRAMREGDS